MDIKNKVALVTGGAAGIGRAYCEELLKNGAKVSVCDINSDAGEEVVHQLSGKYGKDNVIFCSCDVTDYPQYEESFQTTVNVFGGLDIVINNAGIMNDRFWELEVDVNLNGAIRGTLLALKFMGKDRNASGRGGVVINTGSNVGIRPYVSVPIYTATKHALIGLTRSFGDAYHVNLTGVKVIALCPGATDTALVTDVKKQLLSSEYEKAWQRDTASSIVQKPEHVAKALIHVMQKAASGSVWAVDNGQPPREVTFHSS
ncbi:15-hydroxyprostaglandin dehydrogenase [NAD(+)]-like [Hetaerina americana]|uniref:15-hydroxyprostaglandin dehydrogenase [NAD(+)]-like n=1 Tax=Hetaerina americana TaxID=62018 RepID=UPI003A7F0F39